MLEDFSIFKFISEDDVNFLESNLKIVKFKKREIVFREGEGSNWCFFLLKGNIKISKIANDGREIVLEIIEAPDFFGVLAVLKGIPYPATAQALDECEIAMIPSSNFLQVIKKYPLIESQILYHVTTRLREGIESLKNIAVEDVSSRLMYQLIKLAKKYGKVTKEGILIDLRVTKQQLAEMTGTTTETTIRVIGKLKKAGYLTERERKFLITDKKAIQLILF